MGTVKTVNNDTIFKARITLNEAQPLNGECKNYLDINFNNFSEVDRIIKENNIDKNNLWSIDFR